MSLLEALVALSVFALAILLIFAFFPGAKDASMLGRHMATAQSLARELLERERALPYSDVGEVTSAAVAPPEVFNVSSVVNGVQFETEFRATVTVSEIEPSKVKDILVTVVWDEGEKTHKVELETFKVQYPVLVSP